MQRNYILHTPTEDNFNILFYFGLQSTLYIIFFYFIKGY